MKLVWELTARLWLETPPPPQIKDREKAICLRIYAGARQGEGLLPVAKGRLRFKTELEGLRGCCSQVPRTGVASFTWHSITVKPVAAALGHISVCVRGCVTPHISLVV